MAGQTASPGADHGEAERLGQTFYDITQLLASASGAEDRVGRVLDLLRGLVPYHQLALLEVRLGYEPHIVVVPEPPPAERALLTKTLLDIFGQLIDAGTSASARAALAPGGHLAVPLVALDEVTGLLFVRSSAEDYTDQHLRALSVVAAKLAGYFAMLHARADLVDLAREREEARRGAQAADDRLLADVRVLVVDHDFALRESLQSVLDHYGAQVTAVESAPEALAVLERARPDVLLFGDLAIRGESSYDVMREITARAHPLPIASISAWRLEEKEREAAAGLRLHLAKPLEIGALLDAVVELAGRGQTKPGQTKPGNDVP